MPPNIILITTDQQRFDTIGPDKPTFLRMPHTDQLCHEGVRFSRAYADCPVCVPSRTQIMTGKYAHNHGMTVNGKTSDRFGHDNTLATDMSRLGYDTVAIGKMHFGPQRCRHGFDEMILPDDYYRQMRRSGQLVQPMRHGLGQCELEPTMSTVPEAMTLTSWTAQQCVDYILHRRDPTRPFFMWCSFSKPHQPFDPPEPYWSMYHDADIPLPVYGDWSDDEHVPPAMARLRQSQHYDLLTPETIRAARVAYYGLLTQIDYNIGSIFGALQDINLFEDTMFVFTSDHGEFLGDHFAGGKQHFHDVSARLPMIIRQPRNVDDRLFGETCDHLASLADLRATLAAAGGGEPTGEHDGLDLLALARGETRPRQYLEATFGFEHDPAYVAITDGRWKYIFFVEGGVEQLFDLQNDPRELSNLTEEPTVKDEKFRLKKELEKRLTARRSVCISDGKLCARPLKGDSVAERRAMRWGGYHTDEYDMDVRH